MSTYLAAARIGIRAIALIGILPGAVVAAAYLLVLSGQLYQHWDARTAVVLGMAAWGVLGVVELWHEYVRLSRPRADGERRPLSPRALLFVWALLLLPFAAWKADAGASTDVPNCGDRLAMSIFRFALRFLAATGLLAWLYLAPPSGIFRAWLIDGIGLLYLY